MGREKDEIATTTPNGGPYKKKKEKQQKGKLFIQQNEHRGKLLAIKYNLSTLCYTRPNNPIE